MNTLTGTSEALIESHSTYPNRTLGDLYFSARIDGIATLGRDVVKK